MLESVWYFLFGLGITLLVLGIVWRRGRKREERRHTTAPGRAEREAAAPVAARTEQTAMPPRRSRLAETVAILAGIVSILVGLVTLLEKLR